MKFNSIKFKVGNLFTIILGIILILYSVFLQISLSKYLINDLDEYIAGSSKGVDQRLLERSVHFVPQVPDINVDDVGETVEALVPNVLGDHRARDHLFRAEHEIFQQGVFFG